MGFGRDLYIIYHTVFFYVSKEALERVVQNSPG